MRMKGLMFEDVFPNLWSDCRADGLYLRNAFKVANHFNGLGGYDPYVYRYKQSKPRGHWSGYDDAEWRRSEYRNACYCADCEVERYRYSGGSPSGEGSEIAVQYNRPTQKKFHNNVNRSYGDTEISGNRPDKISESDPAKGSILWKPKLHLTVNDRDQLTSNDMLTDKHIWAAQRLINLKYPNIGGLQDPLLAQTHSLRACGGDIPNVQIHHNGQLHWVASSSYGDIVHLYDSMNGDISDSLKEQLLTIYRNQVREGTLVVDVMSAQLQEGSKDCGLFAIATSVALAEGRNPENITFDQSQMRTHLLRCFETGDITSFPEIGGNDDNQKKRHKEEIVLLTAS